MPEQDAAFVGAMPRFYDQHLRALLFQPYAEEMADRLGSLAAGDLLETAAGSGILTEALRTRLPEAVAITATDLNQPMLDHAMGKPGLVGVRFQQADAQALPFPDGSFDMVVCQFGVMFFPDRVAAYREARRVLRPRGKFLFSAWGSRAANPVMDAAVTGLERCYPTHESWFLERVPCGYHHVRTIRADVRAAGFADSTVTRVFRAGHAPDARGAALGLCQGSPMRAEIEARDPGGLEAATAAAEAAIAARCGAGAFTTPLQALVVEAVG